MLNERIQRLTNCYDWTPPPFSCCLRSCTSPCVLSASVFATLAAAAAAAWSSFEGIAPDSGIAAVAILPIVYAENLAAGALAVSEIARECFCVPMSLRPTGDQDAWRGDRMEGNLPCLPHSPWWNENKQGWIEPASHTTIKMIGRVRRAQEIMMTTMGR